MQTSVRAKDGKGGYLSSGIAIRHRLRTHISTTRIRTTFVEDWKQIGFTEEDYEFIFTMPGHFSAAVIELIPSSQKLHGYDGTECFPAPEWLDVCMENMEKIIEELK